MFDLLASMMPSSSLKFPLMVPRLDIKVSRGGGRAATEAGDRVALPGVSGAGDSTNDAREGGVSAMAAPECGERTPVGSRGITGSTVLAAAAAEDAWELF